MKALVGAFNQEKALVGAFSVIVQLHRLTAVSVSIIMAVSRQAAGRDQLRKSIMIFPNNDQKWSMCAAAACEGNYLSTLRF